MKGEHANDMTSSQADSKLKDARRWTIRVRSTPHGFHVGWEGSELYQFCEGGKLKEQDIQIIEAAPVLAEIERLKLALEKAKEQRNTYHSIADCEGLAAFSIDTLDAEIQEILEGK